VRVRRGYERQEAKGRRLEVKGFVVGEGLRAEGRSGPYVPVWGEVTWAGGRR